VTTLLGPVLGGTLAGAGLWRVVFFINLPLAGLVLLLVARHVPESRPDSPGKMDLAGTILVTLALAGVTYGAIEGPEQGLAAPAVLGSLALGAGGLAAFVWIERGAPNPVVPLWLFASPTFAGANLLTLLLYAALRAAFFFLGLTLIQAQGYPAQTAGLALVPFTLMLAVLSRWAGGWVDRVGARLPLILGPGLTGFGFALLALPGQASSPADYWTSYLPGVVVMGVGMGITVAPLTTAVMTAVPRDQIGAASGINNAVARIAGVLAIAILGGVALLSFRQELRQSVAGLGLTEPQLRALALQADEFGNAEPPSGLDDRTRQSVSQAIDQSLLITFRRTALICAALALLSSVAGGLLIEARRTPPTPGGSLEADRAGYQPIAL